MTAPATVAMPNITLDRRAPSRHDSTLLGRIKADAPLSRRHHDIRHVDVGAQGMKHKAFCSIDCLRCKSPYDFTKFLVVMK